MQHGPSSAQARYGGQAFTITRVFQVRRNGELEVAGAKQIGAEKVFQVRFKLFQVCVGSDWTIGIYIKGGEKLGGNGRKLGEFSKSRSFLPRMGPDGHGFFTKVNEGNEGGAKRTDWCSCRKTEQRTNKDGHGFLTGGNGGNKREAKRNWARKSRDGWSWICTENVQVWRSGP